VRCKTCQKKHNSDYYDKTRDIQIASATKRNKEKGEDYLAYLRNWHQENLDYHRNQNNQWYANNKAYRQEYMANWRKENPDYMNDINNQWRGHKEHNISKDELKVLYEYCDCKCMYCGMPLELHYEVYNKQLFKDHAINDGANDISNCVLCCNSCSSKKRDRDWNVWYIPSNPVFKEERYKNIEYWLNNYKYILENVHKP
jgi:hypothetical protein